MSDSEKKPKPESDGVARVPVRLGVMPASIDEAWRLAVAMAKSDLVPVHFRGKPEDVLVTLEYAAEIGLAPMQGLQSIKVVNGQPGLYGDGMLALIMASRLYLDHSEYFEVDGKAFDRLTDEHLKDDRTAAVCIFMRREKATPVERSFSIAQAKRANLWQKPGTWQQYPDRMLRMRARSFAARDCFPDLLKGIRTAEELDDIPGDDAPKPYVIRRTSEVETTADALTDAEKNDSVNEREE